VLGKKRPTYKRQTTNKGISFSLSLFPRVKEKLGNEKKKRSKDKTKSMVSNEGTKKEDLEWDLNEPLGLSENL
jgi:hypothetical protein